MPRAKKSKKQSDSTAGAEWRPSQVYFIDNALGRGAVPNALRALSVPVQLHLDHFPGNAPDTEWIPPVAARRWAILTKDRNIRHNPLELAAVLDNAACYVCMRCGEMNGEQLAALAARFIRKVDAVAAAAIWPVLMRVTSSELTVLIDKEWTPATAQHMNPAFWRRRAYRR